MDSGSNPKKSKKDKFIYLLLGKLHSVFLEQVIIRVEFLIYTADMNFKLHNLQVHIMANARKMVYPPNIAVLTR